MQKILLAVALVLGGLITYVDSQPTWDDTGVTALAILVTCGSLGFMAPKRPWLWALAVGLWIPLLGIVGTHNYGSLLALLIAFAGAYAGMAIRKVIAPART
ncbi:MAG: hypothetical protein NT151_10060 [Acidobacteria bacterium]|nr:hypothetical protein [Acidobacteriota bacterium]